MDRHRKLLAWSAYACSATVVLIDIQIALGVAVGMLHVVAIWLAYRSQDQATVLRAAMLGTLGMGVGTWASPAGGVLSHIVANRAISLLAIWMIAWQSRILLRTRAVEQARLQEVVRATTALEATHIEDVRKRRVLSSILEDLQRESTHRQQLEYELRLTQYAVDHAADMVVFVQADGTLTYANHQAAAALGYDREQLVGMAAADFDATHEADRLRELVAATKEDGPVTFESRHRRKDGTVYACEVNVAHIQFGGEDLLVECARDLSERRREAALRTKLFDKAPHPQLIYRNDCVVDCNEAAVEILRAAGRDDVVGRACTELSPAEQPDGQVSAEKLAEWQAVARRDGSHRGEWMHCTLDGAALPCDVTQTPIVLEEGPALLAGWVDLREQKRTQAQLLEGQRRLEDALQQSNKLVEELRNANDQLASFSYVASHDLQEPLRNLLAYAALLREDVGESLSPDAAEDLEFITSAATRMQRLIDDLLAFARAGQQPIECEDVALASCLQDAVDALRLRIVETNATIHTSALPVVRGDRTLIAQLLQNLIGNAIKFCDGDAPEVWITATRTATAWTIGVKDNGIGIRPEHSEQIFAPFRRLHGMTAFEGSGIGLAICRRIVERHGGTIRVESEPGHGAHFQFDLPVAQNEVQPCLINA